MRTYKKYCDGFICGTQTALDIAALRLAKCPPGCQLLLTSMSGRDLFVKTDSGVRVSTKEEWGQYWTGVRHAKAKQIAKELAKASLQGPRDPASRGSTRTKTTPSRNR